MKIRNYVKPYRWQFGLGFISKLTEALLELYLPILMATVLDVGIRGGNRPLILRTGGEMLLFVLLGFGCAALAQYSAAKTSQRIGTDMRQDLKEHISRFSFRELDSLPTSTLINRITGDVNNVQHAIAMTIRLASRAPFIGIGSIIMAYSIDPRLTIIFVAIIPLVSGIIFLFMRVTSPLYQVVQEKLDTFTLHIRETLSGVRVIRAFAHAKEQEEKATASAEAVCQSNIKVSSISAWMQPTSAVVINFGILVILYLGARKVAGGTLQQGDILALTLYANKILYAISSTAGLIVLFTKASASTKRLREVLETEPSLTYPAVDIPLDNNCHTVLELDNVSFGYSQQMPALSSVSLQVHRGETVGIVGVTGSGKSTLLLLMQRHYDPQQGHVEFLGQPISSMSEQQLRGHIGVVPQQNVLFSGSIADNLRMAYPEATEPQIIVALQTAQCWDFVSALPQGIHTPVFEGGKNFSGGQRQRLAIARGLVGQPSVLMLDDSLSALDYQTDLALREALSHDLPDLAKVIVSQRISSVQSAHRIYVLEQGRLVAEGTHEQLLETNQTYLAMYQSQSEQEVSA